MLLILTSNRDFAADYLIVELIERGLPYFRLNSEEIHEAAFRFSVDRLDARRNLRLGLRSLDLDRVSAVWYRRAVHPNSVPSLSPAENLFIAGELRHLAMGLLLNPQVTWVNAIDKVSVAEHKLFQLRIAVSLGFSIPRTLVSNDIEELKRFVAEAKSAAICKPIFHGMFFDGQSPHAIFTRRVDIGDLNSDSLEACPILVQDEISRIADVRATFVGGKCFVADIIGEPTVVDWRDPTNDVTYFRSDLDEETKTRCRLMLKELGLVYGAFDFIRTESGQLVFLELNPTGEWAWLEEELNFPMREAFLEVFYGGNR